MPTLPIVTTPEACDHVVVVGGTSRREVIRQDGRAILQSEQGGFSLVTGDRTAWIGRSAPLTFRDETDGIAWMIASNPYFGDIEAVIAVDVRRGTLWTVSLDDPTRKVIPWSDLRKKLPE